MSSTPSTYRTQDEDLLTEAHPNAACGTYDAIEAKFGIPILYTSRHRDLATERAASWLSKYFTYWWLEQNGHDRCLIETDGLWRSFMPHKPIIRSILNPRKCNLCSVRT